MLRGDPSDGLPGVPGIGAKTAATLVGRFGSWEELRAAVTDRGDTPARPRRCAPSSPPPAPYLAVVEPVVRVALDAPVRLARADRFRRPRSTRERLAELAERWALGGTVERLVAALGALAVAGDAEGRPSGSEVRAAPRARRVANSASARASAAGSWTLHQPVAASADGVRSPR